MAVTPILLLVLIQIGTSFVSLKSRTIRLLFDGKPSILIRDGKLNRKEMMKQRYNLDDLMLQLRENQVTEIEEVELAVLESTGKLSVIMKEVSSQSERVSGATKEPARTEDSATTKKMPMKKHPYRKAEPTPKFRYELLPLPLIMDGQVQDDSLEKIGKTRFWLKSELQRYNVDNFKHVFFCSIDHRGKLYVDRK